MLNAKHLSPWPFYETDEIEAAQATLTSGQVNYWTGKNGQAFEKAYADYVGKRFGIAVSNGTVALEAALRAFHIGEGDQVIVTSRSYVASASCVSLVSAIPIFADVDLDTGNISADTIAPLINQKTKAIIPVHIGGLPCDMAAIMDLAKQHDIVVIEDCAQAHGAVVSKQPVGAWGDAAIFSFCQDKIMSTGGEGGMLLLDDEAAYKTAWAYKDIGRSYDAVFNQAHPPGFRWYTNSIGSNFRMTEFQAAIGLKQLKKLDKWIARRNHIADGLMKMLKQYPFIEIKPTPDYVNKHAYYRLYATIKADHAINGRMNRQLRDHVIARLVAQDIPCFSGSCSEIYLEKAFAAQQVEHQPNAHFFTENAFCLLTHHTITDNELTKMICLIKETLDEF